MVINKDVVRMRLNVAQLSSRDLLSERPMQRWPSMSPEEFADLEREAGRSFLSERQAQDFRMRKIRAQAIQNMLEGPHVDHRRVQRD